MPPARAGGRRHSIRRLGFDDYELSWQVEVKYKGSRILHHRTMLRETNRAGAEKFAKKWNVSMPEEAPGAPKPQPKPPSKTEIARQLGDKIHAHLVRIENDPKLNPSKHYNKAKGEWTIDKTGMGMRDFFSASAHGTRHRVWVIYVSYQGGSYLTVDEAQRYLDWLDAGNVGRHYEALRASG